MFGCFLRFVQRRLLRIEERVICDFAKIVSTGYSSLIHCRYRLITILSPHDELKLSFVENILGASTIGSVETTTTSVSGTPISPKSVEVARLLTKVGLIFWRSSFRLPILRRVFSFFICLLHTNKCTLLF